MTNTIKRIILFVLAIPGIGAVILFVPWYGHIGVIVILVLVGLACGIELRRILNGPAPALPRWSVILPALAPVLAWAANMGRLPGWAAGYILAILILWAISGPVMAGEGRLPSGLAAIGSRLLLVMYPTYLLWWVARLTWFDHTPKVLLLFMFAVFLNDSGAWLFGVTLGRHRGIIPVSPNKSLEGFLGGIFASVLVFTAASFLLPEVLPHPLWQTILFGLIFGVAVIAGDLTESALKRAVGVKDSGKIIFGRGGMLDSVDSIIFSAPLMVMFLERATIR